MHDFVERPGNSKSILPIQLPAGKRLIVEAFIAAWSIPEQSPREEFLPFLR